MSKWYGNVGYVISEEDPERPGIFREMLYPHVYCLEDVNRGVRVSDAQGSINKNISLSNRISFIADPYAFEHFSSIKYVEKLNVKWEVSSITVEYPRIIMSLGEVYNG